VAQSCGLALGTGPNSAGSIKIRKTYEGQTAAFLQITLNAARVPRSAYISGKR